MKFIVFTTVMSVWTFLAQAQDLRTFGIRAGVNFQNVTYEDLDGERFETKLKPGFHLGVNVEVPLDVEFYIQPGLLFSTKGAKLDHSDTKINLAYIEIPINFLYKPEVGDGRLLLGIGPYIAFGMSGKVKNGSDNDVEWKNKITYSEYQDGPLTLKRFDTGGNLLFGYEFSNSFSVQLNAQLGLVNIHPKVTGAGSDDASFKNTGFGISAGYRF